MSGQPLKEKQESILPDEKNRANIRDYPGHVFVSAGAGSGKSTSLARRITRLISSGELSFMNRLVAITFTNKAAFELREKISGEISEKMKAFPEPSSPEAVRLVSAKRSLREAGIGTIHSFCGSLLRLFPEQAGIDGRFEIMSREEQERFFGAVFREYAHLSWNGLRGAEIRGIWQSIFQRQKNNDPVLIAANLQKIISGPPLSADGGEMSFPVSSEAVLTEKLDRAFARHRENFLHLVSSYDTAAELKNKGQTSFGGFLMEMSDFLRGCASYRQWRENIINQPDTRTRPSVKFLLAGREEQYKAALSAYRKLFRGTLTAEDQRAILGEESQAAIFRDENGLCLLDFSWLENEYLRSLWYRAGSDFLRFYGEWKQKHNRLDFQDLITHALKLTADEQCLKKIRSLYDHIFVDEFQDTDPEQNELFNRLAGKDGKMKLFRVGDEKQSIYRFRGADLETYRREKSRFVSEKTGLLESLSVNMRSRERVLRHVNTLFSDERSPLRMRDYEPLTPLRKDDDPETGIFHPVFSGTDPASEKGGALKVRSRRRMEAEYIAEAIAATAEGQSIAILFQSLSGIEEYLIALQKKGISCRVLGRRYYADNLPLRFLSALLSFLADPSDLTALTAVLRSPLGGFSDGELTVLKKENLLAKTGKVKDFPGENLSPDLSRRFAHCSGLLYWLRSVAQCASPDSLLETIYTSFPFFETALFYRDHLAVREGLLRVHEYAFELSITSSEEGQTGRLANLADFASSLSGVLEESRPSDEIEDAGGVRVQIMSYHKAKGLEYDHVFLPDTARKKTAAPSPLLIDRDPDSGEIIFHYGKDLAAARIESPKEKISRRETEERNRLFYVGLTRARKRCIIPLFTGIESRDRGSIHHDLMQFYGDCGADFSQSAKITTPADLCCTFFPAASEKVEETVSGLLDEDRLRHFSIRPWQAAPSVPVTVFSSSTARKKKQEEKEISKGISHAGFSSHQDPETEGREWQISRSAGEVREIVRVFQDAFTLPRKTIPAKIRGIFAHMVFELADLESPEIGASQLRRLENSYSLRAYRNVLEELLEYGREMLAVYRKSSLFTLIRSATILGREIPFSHRQQPKGDGNLTILVGYLDLMVRDMLGTIHIIDYKTASRVSGMNQAAFRENQLQTNREAMELYREAMVAVYPDVPIRCALYLTQSGDLVYYPDL